jgi:hypothetical protein
MENCMISLRLISLMGSLRVFALSVPAFLVMAAPILAQYEPEAFTIVKNALNENPPNPAEAAMILLKYKDPGARAHLRGTWMRTLEERAPGKAPDRRKKVQELLGAFEGSFAAGDGAKPRARTFIKLRDELLGRTTSEEELDRFATTFLDRLRKLPEAQSTVLLEYVRQCRERTTSDAVAAEPPEARDVELILAWLRGGKAGGVFRKEFGDSKVLTDAGDALLYTDVTGVNCPKGLRLVPYDFIKARMDRIHSGRKVSPAVLVTRSVKNDSADDDDRRGKVGRTEMKDERYYYIEVAIGNLAWHWIKIVVGTVDGKPKAMILHWVVS